MSAGGAAAEVRVPYSSGAYLHVLDRSRERWRREADALRALPGLGHIELWIEDPVLADGDLEALREVCAGLRVLVHAPHLQLSMISHHDLVRGAAAEVYRRTLALADALSAELVTFHGGTRSVLVDEALGLDQLAAMFAALRSTGCRAEPVLKNALGEGALLGAYPSTLEDLRRALERMPELRITLDVGNCVRSGDNWIGFLRAYAPRIAHVHLHGAADPFALARLLRAVGHGGFLSVASEPGGATAAAWALWQEAQAEASQETTATLELRSTAER